MIYKFIYCYNKNVEVLNTDLYFAKSCWALKTIGDIWKKIVFIAIVSIEF